MMGWGSDRLMLIVWFVTCRPGELAPRSEASDQSLSYSRGPTEFGGARSKGIHDLDLEHLTLTSTET
jgi:hypothetical protein